MSLKRNILISYVCQFYSTIIGIATLPLLIGYIGAEAYGLVGFFYLLQSWFAILDMGLSPTVSREAARYSAGASNALVYRLLVRSLEGIFFVTAIVAGGCLFVAADYIALHWLKSTHLTVSEIKQSLQLMAITVALRWICGLYRGIISGCEKLVWLGIFNSLIASLRFILVLPMVIFVSTEPTAFFFYQMIISIIELSGLIIYSYLLLPTIPKGRSLVWHWAPLKPVIKFSISIAFTSSVWILVTQTDKLVLSKILSLTDYGYFTLAVMVASGIMIIIGPVSAAIMPRMSNLEAQSKSNELIDLYRQATQFVAVVAGATTTAVALNSEIILQAWTGDAVLAKKAAPILSLYAWGNGVLTVAAFPYYLQYAKGDLRLHLIGNVVFAILLIPTIALVASKYHGIGAGYVWLSMNLLSFIVWLPLVHRKFAPGLNHKWYINDILAIFIPIIVVGILLNTFTISSDSRWLSLMQLCLMEGALLITGILSSSEMRQKAKKMLKVYTYP